MIWKYNGDSIDLKSEIAIQPCWVPVSQREQTKAGLLHCVGLLILMTQGEIELLLRLEETINVGWSEVVLSSPT